MSSKIVQVEWFSAHRDTIGAVLILDDHQGYKAYLGVAAGGEPESDSEFIRKYGCKISRRHAEAIFPWIQNEVYDGRDHEGR